MTPPSIAIAVWGLVTGVAMVNNGLSPAMAVVMSLTVFAGSAQLAVIPLMADRAPLVVIWLTAALVNLRFVIFSAASRQYFTKLSFVQRSVASYFNSDFGFALFIGRYGNSRELGTPEQWGFFYGSAAMNWVVWQVASITGILLGDVAPASWGLELAAILGLLAVLIPMVRDRAGLAGTLTAAAVSVAAVQLPFRLGVLVGVFLGVAVALTIEARTTP
jgi:predicted branched-subunit amino acid permease